MTNKLGDLVQEVDNRKTSYTVSSLSKKFLQVSSDPNNFTHVTPESKQVREIEALNITKESDIEANNNSRKYKMQ